MASDFSGGTGNFWYSFDHGMAHFIQLATETDLDRGFIALDEPGGSEKENSNPFNPIMNAQTTWLANDLAAVDRSKNSVGDCCRASPMVCQLRKRIICHLHGM